jgi:hypothetical protein
MNAARQKQLVTGYDGAISVRVDFGKAWTCPWPDLASYPITPLSVCNDYCWIVPPEWCPPNRRQFKDRCISWTEALPVGFDPEAAAGVIRRLHRMSILDFFQTARFSHNKVSSPPTPCTWVNRSRNLIRAARHILSLPASEERPPAWEEKTSKCPDGRTLFLSLTGEQFSTLKASVRTWGVINIARLNALYVDGYFDDWPAVGVAPLQRRRREGSKASEHFSDAAFTEILAAAFWLNSIQRDLVEAYIETSKFRALGCREVRFERRRERVRSWRSNALQPSIPFPYTVDCASAGRTSRRFKAWPLDTLGGLRSLLGLCQTANAVLILTATAMRIGELMALTQMSLVHLDGRLYLVGPTFKPTDNPAGDARNYPFPQAAVAGWEAQKELSQALTGGKSFWVASGKNTTGFPQLNSSLLRFGTRIRLPDGRALCELDGNITPHRFRYSTYGSWLWR